MGDSAAACPQLAQARGETLTAVPGAPHFLPVVGQINRGTIRGSCRGGVTLSLAVPGGPLFAPAGSAAQVTKVLGETRSGDAGCSPLPAPGWGQKSRWQRGGVTLSLAVPGGPLFVPAGSATQVTNPMSI